MGGCASLSVQLRPVHFRNHSAAWMQRRETHDPQRFCLLLDTLFMQLKQTQLPRPIASSSTPSAVSPNTTAQLNDSIKGDDLDIEKLLNQIRSRYKMLCVSLGVQPSLRAHQGSRSGSSKNGSEVKEGRSTSSRLSQKPPVWKLENSEATDLSFWYLMMIGIQGMIKGLNMRTVYPFILYVVSNWPNIIS